MLDQPVLNRELLGALIVIAVLFIGLLWMVVGLGTRIEELEKQNKGKDKR